MVSLSAGSSGHVGGALGLSGLLAALAGCTFLQMQAPGGAVGSDASAFMPWSLSQVHVGPAEADGAGVNEVVLTETSPEMDRAVPSIARPAATPRQDRTERSVQPAQAGTLMRSASFIVKLRGEPIIDEIIANCRSDRAAAEALWLDWSEGDAVFSGMTLQSCSYSGELILDAEITDGPQGLESAVDALLSRIRDHGSVAYADPDFTAFPGASGE